MQTRTDKSCPDENALVAFVGGATESREEVEEHLSRCRSCLGTVAVIADGLATTPHRHAAQTGAASDGSGSGSFPGTSGADGSADTLVRGAAVGRFIILDRLGAGGMGVVYSAYDPQLDRKIALKLLRPRVAEMDQSSIDASIREARLMAKLAHPNVVAVFDAGQLGGHAWIAMEFVVGTSLRAWVRDGSRRLQDILPHFVAAGTGLAAAHASQVLHLDFKPDNVLVGEDGRTRITDFGLSRIALQGSDGTPRVLRGTPGYIAPEQFRAVHADAASDQFSFCVSLYEALCGERPFPSDSARGFLEAVDRGLAPRPPTGRPIPPAVWAALRRGLHPDPCRRFPSVSALLSVLQPRRRTWHWVAAAGVITALGVGVSALAWTQRQRASSCLEEDAQVRSLVSAEARAARAAAFNATGKLFAADAWTRLEDSLEAYARRWSALHQEACLTGAARFGSGLKSTAQQQCLAERKQALAVLTRLYAAPDAAMVLRAPVAVEALPSLAECERVSTSDTAASPASPASKQRTEILRQVAEARTLLEIGRFADGIETATTALARARADGMTASEAEAAWVLGMLRRLMNDGAGAEQAMRASVLAAQRAGEPRTEAWAWTGLAYALSIDGSRVREVEDATRHAEAVLARMGGDDEIQSAAHTFRAMAYGEAERFSDAHVELTRALHLREQRFGPADRRTLASVQNLAEVIAIQGTILDAMPLQVRAFAASEKAFGPNHPGLATIATNLARSLHRTARFAEARELYERGLRIAEAGMSFPAADTLTTLGELSETYVALDLLEEAETLLQRFSGPEAGHHTPLQMALLRRRVGDVHAARGRWGKARDEYESGIAFAQKEADRAGAIGFEKRLVLGVLHERLGRAHLAQSRPRDAELALELSRQLLTLDTPSLLRLHLADAELARGELFLRTGRKHEARDALEASLALREQTVGAAHPQAAAAREALQRLR